MATRAAIAHENGWKFAVAGWTILVVGANPVCDYCYLQNEIHKPFSTPTDFPAEDKYCTQYQDASCCTAEIARKIGNREPIYDPAVTFNYESCGPLSQKCLDFFINEECFYECDVNIGKFRRHQQCEETLPNGALEVIDVPIKASYCRSWYEACKDDRLCAGENGSIFDLECFEDNVEPYCQTVAEHYNGRPEEFCNKTFGSAFYYETEENNAYSMWFQKGAANPNDWVLPWVDYPDRCGFHSEDDTAAVCAAALAPDQSKSYKDVAIAAIVLSCISIVLWVVMFGFVCNFPGCGSKKQFDPMT